MGYSFFCAVSLIHKLNHPWNNDCRGNSCQHSPHNSSLQNSQIHNPWRQQYYSKNFQACRGQNTSALPVFRFFFKPDRSSPSPALVRIMISAILRNSDDIPRMLSSNRSSIYGPRTMPVISIPSKPGSFIFPADPAHGHTNQ